MRSNAVIIFAAKWILNLSQREAKSKGNTRQLIHKTYWRAAAQHSTHQLEQSHAKEKQHYDHRWYGKQTTANSGIKFKICRIKKTLPSQIYPRARGEILHDLCTPYRWLLTTSAKEIEKMKMMKCHQVNDVCAKGY